MASHLSSELKIGFDWLCFTFPVSYSLDSVFEILNFDINNFTALDHGGKGYKRMAICNSSNIRIYHDGNQNMGINVQVSGSAINYFLSCFRSYLNEGFYNISDEELVRYILFLLKDIGCNFTRIDIALDDIGNNYFSVDDIAAYFDKYQISTRFKSYVHNKPCDAKSHDVLGNSIYFGKGSSNCMLRIYDKQLEQNTKLDSDKKIVTPWTRWEFEVKQGHANKFIEVFLNESSLSNLFFGLLSNCMRIHLNDDSNVSRCTTLPLWSEFVSSASKFTFGLSKAEPSINRTEKYLIEQAFPSILKYISATGGLPKISFIRLGNIEKKWKADPYWKDFLTEGIHDFIEQEFVL